VTFHGVDEDDALESAAGDGGNDQGIDIAFADPATQEIIILQAYCPDAPDKVVPKAKWDALVAGVPCVRNPDLLRKGGRPDIAESIEKLKSSNPDYGLSMGLISLGLRSEAVTKSVAAHLSDPANCDVSFFVFTQQEIVSNYDALIDAENGIPEDELKFCGDYFGDSGNYGRAWVGSVSAEELQRLFKKHRNKLFAGNIRLYLGARSGGVNDQIIKTAQPTPGNFWALNNGVTIVADSATSVGGQNKSLKLKRFSIVNGCQTTSSLVKANAGASAKVLARVIAAKTNLKTEIVRYNNSQNAVKIWTVRAAGDIQQRLRHEFTEVKINYAPKQEGARRNRK